MAVDILSNICNGIIFLLYMVLLHFDFYFIDIIASLAILNIFRIFVELLYKVSFSLNEFSFLLLIFVSLVS